MIWPLYFLYSHIYLPPNVSTMNGKCTNADHDILFIEKQYKIALEIRGR